MSAQHTSAERVALEELMGALNWRAAVLVSNDKEKLEFADNKLWGAMDRAKAVLASPPSLEGALQQFAAEQEDGPQIGDMFDLYASDESAQEATGDAA